MIPSPTVERLGQWQLALVWHGHVGSRARARAFRIAAIVARQLDAERSDTFDVSWDQSSGRLAIVVEYPNPDEEARVRRALAQAVGRKRP